MNHSTRPVRPAKLVGVVTLILIGAPFVAQQSLADIVTYKDDFVDPISGAAYDGVEDTTLIEAFNDPRNQNFGQRGDMFVAFGTQNTNRRNHVLIRFDISSLAGEFTSINSATLRLYYKGSSPVPLSFSAYRVSAANSVWVEGPGTSSVFSNQFPGSSTWAERLRGTQGSNGTPNGTPWASGPHVFSTNGGVSIAPTDRESTAIGTGSVLGTESSGDAIDVVLNDLSAITDWASGTNSGLVLIPNFGAGSGITFFSSEANIGVPSNIQFHPELIIDFNAVPEPSATCLLAIGSLAFLSRRRRKKNARTNR